MKKTYIKSLQGEAIAFVEQNTPTQQSPIFPNLSPEELNKKLIERIQNPEKMDQDKGTNFCWAAAITYIIWEDNPTALAKATIDLYNTGHFHYHDVHADPSSAVAVAVGSEAFHNNMNLENKVDQLLFMTLADEEEYKGWTNIDKEYHPEDEDDPKWSGRVFDSIYRLYQDFGYEVEAFGSDFGNSFLVPDKYDYFEKARQVLETHDVILFVNSQRFKDDYKSGWAKFKSDLRFFGNHYLRLSMINEINTNLYNIGFWDYGLWQSQIMTSGYFNKSVFGVIQLKKK